MLNGWWRLLKVQLACAGGLGMAFASGGLAAHPITDAYQGGFWNSGTTGSILTEICSKDWKPGAFDPCGAYLAGIIDGLGLGLIYCPQQGVTTRQLAMIAHKAIWDDPTRWDRPAAIVIAERLSSVYPCSAKT